MSEDSTEQTTEDTVDTTVEAEQPESSEDNPNREAAKYRTRLRDTEAERDKLAATLTALQRSAVESIAAAQGVTADALWAAGNELDNLLGEDGQPDADAITTAVVTTRDKLGITARRASAKGLQSGTMRQQPPANRWREAFAQKPQ